MKYYNMIVLLKLVLSCYFCNQLISISTNFVIKITALYLPSEFLRKSSKRDHGKMGYIQVCRNSIVGLRRGQKRKTS